MAKKKGGGGPAESKKTQQKKKQQQIEDKTFGLKNKNKSAKVRAHVKSVEKSVLNSGDPRMRRLEEQRTKQKAEAKARRKAAKQEQQALFDEALLAVQKKGKNLKAGKVSAQGRDGDDDKKKAGTSRAMKMMYQMDAKEMEERLRDDPNYVPTLEDNIEAERQRKLAELKESGKTGTPVTEESFRAWQERKRKRKADEARKKVEAELKKKKGGKGLSVLSGRALYEYKKELFVDKDEDGAAVVSPKSIPEENGNSVDHVAEKVEENLFLEGDDDDLDDLDED
uniref:ZC3H15/TMA46 family C-terminal domain-containing protein n=1 Tax=Grammatophora oceanica TaxID=210454 RepID=A0A7S1VVP4_9STRA|mmetsp:Transcript_9611/g.14109  ORF Transcript_9611/g.14109 Transcript_9611/m.14109 type:complete len:282 (+) Transcript_9611:98-943(+)|eukprot:CAMPEP_0194028426 /NCGR_PEP_ID=MMETSP0009_2-20130614/2393_1 /TAXON_ID=210454 /ORGANISM="Grammatophora oceanica, Strain CCMP 410" /LENGTH=281 /DNA_ID=CAMNT_0038667815 /DNA_START=36 /DNA_END=881 /DNA_ORIENTATION=-